MGAFRFLLLHTTTMLLHTTTMRTHVAIDGHDCGQCMDDGTSPCCAVGVLCSVVSQSHAPLFFPFTHRLLAPERATSPLRLSTGEDGLMVQLPSPTQRKSARRADRRGSLRSGSDHHNFSTAALALKMQQQEQQGTAADDGDGDRKSMHDA
jgi:hypothetical protein